MTITSIQPRALRFSRYRQSYVWPDHCENLKAMTHLITENIACQILGQIWLITPPGGTSGGQSWNLRTPPPPPARFELPPCSHCIHHVDDVCTVPDPVKLSEMGWPNNMKYKLSHLAAIFFSENFLQAGGGGHAPPPPPPLLLQPRHHIGLKLFSMVKFLLCRN